MDGSGRETRANRGSHVVLMGKLNTSELSWTPFPIAPTQPPLLSTLFTTCTRSFLLGRFFFLFSHFSFAPNPYAPPTHPFLHFRAPVRLTTLLPSVSVSPPFMTAPTQALPPWLSDSTSLGTNAAGEPTATFTTVVNIPLTYFGPSVSNSNLQSHLLWGPVGHPVNSA